MAISNDCGVSGIAEQPMRRLERMYKKYFMIISMFGIDGRAQGYRPYNPLSVDFTG